MNFKEARKLARTGEAGSFLTPAKQKELGWFVEKLPSQRCVFWVHRDGRIDPLKTEFAKQWIRDYYERRKNVKKA